MNFFLPHAKDDAEAERVLAAIAQFISAPLPAAFEDRIWKVTWKHNGVRYVAEVGKPIDAYFGGEEVIAILESGSCYLICTPNRGVLRGGPVLTNKGDASAIVRFDKSADSD